MTRVLAACVLWVGCAGVEERSTLDTIPKAAAATVRQQARGVAIHKIDREQEAGQEVYEAVWYVAGKKHEAKVTATGVLLELEVEVAEAEVPAAVRVTVEKELGSGAKYVRLKDGSFEAEKTASGKQRELVVGGDGRVVGREQEDDDDEEDDD